jgi:hypothetical protein
MAKKKVVTPVSKKKVVNSDTVSIAIFHEKDTLIGDVVKAITKVHDVEILDVVVDGKKNPTLVVADLYIDLNTISANGIMQAISSNEYVIGYSSEKAVSYHYRKAKLTFGTHVSFEENVLYHVGRFFTGEFQKELSK